MDWEKLGTHTNGRSDEPFSIAPDIRRQHLYVLGRTGAGKSTLLARLALADIARGDGLMVLDPHGDLCEDILDHCPDEHRDRLIYLDFGDAEHPVPLNMFECRPGQDPDTVCSEVIGIFKRLFGEAWGFQFEDLLRNLSLAMISHQFLGDAYVADESHRYNATLKEAHDFLFNQIMRRGYYPFIENDMVADFWQDQYDMMGTLRGRDTVSIAQIRYASSTTNKIRRFLLNRRIYDITANSDRANTIDLRTIMDEKKVLLVNLSKGRLGEDNSALIGSILLSRLVVATLSRADISAEERQGKLFNVIADEFHAFAGDSFQLLLSEARKYGVTLTIAHQFRDQLDLAAKGAVLNAGSLVAMRVAGKDAADIAREFDSTPPETGYRFDARMEKSRETRHWKHETEESCYYTGTELNTGKRFETLYDRVPTHLSYSETERAIANQLTQLPNYTAKVRLADGSHHEVITAALPPRSPRRNEKIDDVRRRSQASYGIWPDERRSVRDRQYFRDLRRQEAYEAELDEQP